MNLADMLANLEDESFLAEVERQLEAGGNPFEIFKACQEGMTLVGEKFQNDEYFISDLVMSGVLFKEASELIAPYLESDADMAVGKVILGTVRGDIHEIGKDLVAVMLKAGGFDVIDLGVDVPKDQFISTLKENPDCRILALSCLLTTCFVSIKETVEAVRTEGLSDVRIMIGGGPVDESVVEFSGADTFGKDAQEAVLIAKGWT